ncbi:hypothetical protein M3210_02290 [Oceanobacillus luteolus]|nr:hypothetical protein [Oceanobacillus luteolus]
MGGFVKVVMGVFKKDK